MGEKKISVNIDGDITSDLSNRFRVPDGYENGSPAWSVKVFGDKCAGYGEDSSTNKVGAARSLLWPGAISVVQGKKFANLYCGYALKTDTLIPGDQSAGKVPGL